MSERTDGGPTIAPAVVVPTFNHAVRLSAILDKIASLGLPCIVVDDGSSDGTECVLNTWLSAHPEVDFVVVRHDRNRGKAAALSTGFATARRQHRTHVATIDSDGQLDPANIPALLGASRANPAALILGVRPESIPGCPARCRVGRRHAGLAVFAQTGRRLSDTQCGLRVYPLELLDRVRCHASRFAFEAEIITRSIWAGRQIIEVPVSCSYEPKGVRVSHFRPYRDSMRQGCTHIRLLGRALLPWSRDHGVTEPVGDSRNRVRRVVGWLDPFRCWRDIRDSDMGSLECGAAVGLGAWIGTLPFFGLHTPLALYVAWRLHLRPPAVVLGSQISIPPVGAVLAVVSFSVGHILLTGSLPSLEGVEFEWSGLAAATWDFGLAWLLGSVIVGLVIGLAVFGALQLLLGRLRADASANAVRSRPSEPLVDPDRGQPAALET